MHLKCIKNQKKYMLTSLVYLSKKSKKMMEIVNIDKESFHTSERIKDFQ